MKNLIIFFLITTSVAFSQETIFTFENFENEFLKYEPVQKENVSDYKFDFGKNVIEETKKSIANNGVFKFGNYWNIAKAFSTLKENKKHIEIAFLKATKFDNICEYIKLWENEKNHFNRDIPETYNLQKEKCKSTLITESKIDLKGYSSENNFDFELIKLINKVSLNDKKYRYGDKDFETKQPELDKKNQIIIDSLYKVHKTYIGKSLVGDEFKTTMWAVIQHSNPEMMEKYLPIIQKAVKDNEIHLATLKMLIDRVYWLKYDYQIFGSQQNVKLANEKRISEVMAKYEIE